MKKEYLQLSLEELIENREFIAWVLRGKHQKEWDSFLSENPEFKNIANKGKQIVELVRDTNDHISKDDILILWKNIENFDNQVRHSRRIKLRNFMRYAAFLVVVLSIGAAWMTYRNPKPYVFSTNSNNIATTQSLLFLSDGTTIDLKNDNSKIALNSNEQITIDNDRIIDLSKTDNPDDTKMNEVVIPYGKKSQLILEDGTKVWLNAGSHMAFPTKFDQKKREVFLEGEAYFEVAHNKSRPFCVNTNEISIKVLGTKFNISAYQSDHLTETVLIEGKVSVSERSALGLFNEETILSPHQKASYNKEKQTISVRDEPDVEFVIAWTEGWFKFSKQSLNEVLNKLQRYYNVQFVYDNEFPTTDLISGKLDLKDSIDQVMNALSDVANLHYRYSGNKIKIDKKIIKLNMKK